MRVRSAAALAVTAAFASAGGPALAAVAGQAAPPKGAATLTSPVTRPFSATTTTPTTITTTATTGTTQTPTTPTSPPDVCLAATRRVIARSLGVRVATVTIKPGEGGNGMPECSYTVQRPRMKSLPHTRARLIVNVDNGPQAWWRLMRKVVEATQIFGTPPPGWHAPIGLPALDEYASWFVSLHALMCANLAHTKLLTVTVNWKHAKRAELIKLARATVMPYRRVRTGPA